MGRVREVVRMQASPLRAAAILAALALAAAACGGGGSTADTGAYPSTGSTPETSAGVPTTSVVDSNSTTTTHIPIVCNFDAEELDVDQIAESTAVGSDADHVSGVGVERSPGCGRVVVDLGTEFSYDVIGPPADTVPGGTSVSVVDGALRIQLATATNVRFDEVDPNVGDGAVLARMPGSSRELEIVVFPNGEFTAFSAKFSDNPARIAVDFSEQPFPTAAIALPLLFDDVIVQSISSTAVGSAVTAPHTVFTGFARPFEAQLEVEIHGQAGDPISVTCESGCTFTGQSIQELGVPTTDWVDAWGEFEFSIADLPAGLYTIRLSNDAGAADSATWVQMPFVIQP